MTKRQKKPTDSAARQQVRTMQRGHLRRSTLFALAGIAMLGLVVSQIPRFPQWNETAHEKFITWTNASGFSIHNVHVIGRQKVSAQFVMQALQINRGMPILSYDPKGAQERLSENPWFKSVNVERRLPDTILIRLKERVPAARWQVNGKLALIDSEGVTLTTENMGEYSNLPIIIGLEARHKLVDLVTLLRGQPQIGKDVVAATWVSNRRWDLTMKNNMIIRLPAVQPELALARLAFLDSKDKIMERDIISVDLRLPDQAILQPTIRANTLIERPDFSEKKDPSKKNI